MQNTGNTNWKYSGEVQWSNTAKKLCKQEQSSVQAIKYITSTKLTGLPYIYLQEILTDSLDLDSDI